MQLVSSDWLGWIRSSHQKVVQVEVWLGPQLLIPDLPIEGGTVIWDLGMDLTCEAKLQVADPEYLPVDANSALAPFGSSLRIGAGIRYPDNRVELVPIFDGPIVQTPTSTEESAFEITATSWLRYVADDRFILPWAGPAGRPVRETITGLLLESLPPGAAVLHVGSDAVVPDGLVWEEDRLGAVKDLAESIGCIVRATPSRDILVAPDPLPDPAATPVRVIDSGQTGVLLSGAKPDLERAERYNGVVATNPDDSAIWALATLDSGPERWGGPFGYKVLFYASPLLTAATVQAAAQTRLNGLTGRSRTVELSMVPDPSLEIGDHVQISWPYQAATYAGATGPPTQLSEIAQIRKMEIPVGLSEMKLELRGSGLLSGATGPSGPSGP